MLESRDSHGIVAMKHDETIIIVLMPYCGPHLELPSFARNLGSVGICQDTLSESHYM